jgi:colicin import membrane protein
VKTAPPKPVAREPRAQPGRLRAIALALVIHALFFGLIIFGVRWQSSPTPPIEAELWDKLPPVAAKPQPEPPPPAPEPPKPEPPKPEPPKPEPPKPEAKAEPPKPDPEIALKAEREKKRLEEARMRAEQEEAAKRKREQEEAARKKREQEEAAKKKREQEEAARKKREEEKRRREEEAAKAEAERARAAALDARQKEFNKFVAAIQNKIRSRANIPDTVTGKPNVHVRIRILPGGDVLDIQVIRSSGNRAYDTAIERAIRSAQPLPVPPADSELFPQFRDLILNIEHER